ncbi:MAG: NnrS family protein [Spirochaetales bacterium]|nr:NnrS family protein [Spirochaetales bacterium]
MAFTNHPLWYAAFRPFFLLTAVLAVLYAILWGLVFLGGISFPGALKEVGPILWHAHTMLSGVVLASAVGFLLTALPEFTGQPFPSRKAGMLLCLLFATGQLALFVPGGLFLSFFAQMVLLVWLLSFALMLLRGPTGRKHRSFAWALFALTITVAGFYYDLWSERNSLRFLRAGVGVWMVLIILALSRISMRILNFYLQEMKDSEVYLARPPRRNIAILCLSLHTAAELGALSAPVQGFLSLAVSASLFHLLSDWHLGRVVLRRYVWPLYSIYHFMALGYGLMGYSLLSGSPYQSAGRHLLMMGGMGVSIYMVLCIAGRAHSGLSLERRAYVPLAVIFLFSAVVFRLLYAFFPDRSFFLVALVCWSIPFFLYMVYMGPVLWGRRADGLEDATSAPLE